MKASPRTIWNVEKWFKTSATHKSPSSPSCPCWPSCLSRRTPGRRWGRRGRGHPAAPRRSRRRWQCSSWLPCHHPPSPEHLLLRLTSQVGGHNMFALLRISHHLLLTLLSGIETSSSGLIGIFFFLRLKYDGISTHIISIPHILREKNLCILFLYLLFMEISYCFLHWFFVLVLNGTFFCMEFLWKNAQFFFTASLPRTALLLSSVSTISLSRREASRPPAAAGLHLSSESGTESLNCHLNYCCTAPHISQHRVHYEKTQGVRQL